MMMKACVAQIAAVALAGVSATSFAASPYADYCRETLKTPGLIRFYSFEEGRGNEVANRAAAGQERIAYTGGPFGSMSVVRTSPYGWRSTTGMRPTVVDPAWIASGRHPGKTALRTGTTGAALHRLCLSGREFAKGCTFALWVRPAGLQSDAGLDLILLGNGGDDGFRLYHQVRPWLKTGEFSLRLGAADQADRRTLAIAQGATGEWHFVAFSLGEGVLRLFVDGRTAEAACTNAVRPRLTDPYPTPAQLNELDERLRSERFVRLGFTFGNKNPEVVDFDELAVFDRSLSVEELTRLWTAGRPAQTAAEQVAATAAFNAAEAARRRIAISVPDDSGGYFRQGSPIPVTVTLPDESLFAGRHEVTIACEQMEGSFRRSETLRVKGGETASASFTPPSCGVYFIDVTVRDAQGGVVRRLDPTRTVAVTPKPPAGGLTARNPMGIWAFNNDFSYDSPVRRVMFLSPFEGWFKGDWRTVAREDFARRRQITPELRTFVCFAYPTKGKLLSRMPADERAKWERYLTEVADFLPEVNAFGVEFMSEPDCNRTTPESASETIAYVARLIRERHPQIRLVPAGCCPTGLPWTDRMLTKEVADLVDGISYHSYRGNPIMEMNLEDPTKPIRAIFAKRPGKSFEYWNSESGYDYLPLVGRRPMNHEEARRAGFDVSVVHGYEMFTTSMPCAPWEEAAALQVHAVLAELALGFKTYAKCLAPGCRESPSLQGVAWTALAGQVLNRQVSVKRLPLASLNMACFVVEQDDGSRIAAVCGMADETVNLRLAPRTEYRTMDMLGNFGTVRTDDNGIVSLKAGMNPVYLFGVPASLNESAVLKIAMPKTMPDDGLLRGVVTVTNEFSRPLTGSLVALPVRGMTMSPAATELRLAPGEAREIPFEVKAVSLRNRAYVACFALRQGERTVAAAAAPFDSNGTTIVLPQLRRAPDPARGAADWAGVPAYTLDNLDDVTHGRPNLACLWLPHWKGAQDLSCTLQLAWVKDEAIYFRLRVKDDVVFPCPPDSNQPFRYDSLELFADTRPVREQGTPRSPGADQAVFAAVDAAAFAASPVQTFCAMGDRPWVEVEGKGRRLSDGYELQGAIRPVKGSAFRVRAGSRLRLDFTVNDTDTAAELRKSALTYHGIFNNYTRCDLWGRYELGLDAAGEEQTEGRRE